VCGKLAPMSPALPGAPVSLREQKLRERHLEIELLTNGARLWRSPAAAGPHALRLVLRTQPRSVSAAERRSARMHPGGIRLLPSRLPFEANPSIIRLSLGSNRARQSHS